MLTRVTFTLAASLAIAGSAVAKDVQIGSTAVILPSPESYCELTDKEPADARVLKEVGDVVSSAARNDLLSMSADCSQLQSWRVSKLPALDDYVQYQTPMGDKDSNLSRAASIKGFCANIRAEGQKIPGTTQDLNARLETAFKGAKFNEMSFLGVLAEDADACYYGLLQKMRTEIGNEKTQVTVAATTIVKGKTVYYNLYTVHRDGADTLSAALERHRRNIPALLAANGDLSGSAEVAKDAAHGGTHDAVPSVPAKELVIPVKDAPVKDAVKDASAKDAPVKGAPMKEAAVKEAAVKEQVAPNSASLHCHFPRKRGAR